MVAHGVFLFGILSLPAATAFLGKTNNIDDDYPDTSLSFTPSKKWTAFRDNSPPSMNKERIEEWAVAPEKRVPESGTSLGDMDDRESRSSTLNTLRSAFRDLDHMIDLPGEPRKDKNRLEEIGYIFVPLLNVTLAHLRTLSSPLAHMELRSIIGSIDELDGILFHSNLSATERKRKVDKWLTQRQWPHESSFHRQLLRDVYATFIAESNRDPNELEQHRLGTAPLSPL